MERVEVHSLHPRLAKKNLNPYLPPVRVTSKVIIPALLSVSPVPL